MKAMPKKTTEFKSGISHSILAWSHQATTAYRFFSKEDFLHMMSDMSVEDIKADIERFKDLEEYEICQKIKFVLRVKENAEKVSIDSLCGMALSGDMD